DHLQTNYLRRPAAGGVKRLQDGPVAQVEALRRLWGVEQFVHRVVAEDMRNPLPKRRRGEQLDNALGGPLLQPEEAVEHFQRDEMASNAGGGETVAAQEFEVTSEVAQRRREVIGQFAAGDPADEAIEVATVGEQRVR